MMWSGLRGWQWSPRPGLRPALVSAVEVTGELPRQVVAGRQALWVLDYELRDHGLVRVGSPRAPWLPRGPWVAHLYPPDTPYWEDTRAATGRRHSAWLLFTGGEEAGLAALVEPRRGYARLLDPGARLAESIRRAAGLGQQLGEGGFATAQAALWETIATALGARHLADETWQVDDQPAPAVPATLVAQVDSYLASSLSRRVTLAEVAAHLHLSVSTLSHRYRAATGRGPIAAHQELRLRQAKALLLRGQPLRVIAEQLGFVDAYHLSRAFKAAAGESPRDYRRRMAGDGPGGPGEPADPSDRSARSDPTEHAH